MTQSGGVDPTFSTRPPPETLASSAPGEWDSETGVAPYVAVSETHSGAVFFVGDRAFKLKKPVRFGFLDFTTAEAREHACRREVELNARLSPDVYLGVAAVTDPAGSVCDHLVVMRRLPADRSIRALIALGRVHEVPIPDLGSLLADFHARTERSPEIESAATRDAMLARWERNGAEMEPLVGRVFDRSAHDKVLDLAFRYLARRGRVFAGRIAAGRVCDGHGDLLADDVFCLDDGVRVLDCLEFDDRLRFCDGLCDVASLAMDLERLGCPEHAEALLSSYRLASADDWPSSLAHHYIGYRAQVRALVSGLRVTQGDDDSIQEANRLLALALTHLDEGRIRLVVIGGPPGTGKSTWAAEAGHLLDAVVFRSDVERKRLAEVSQQGRQTASDADLYRPQVTESTYRALMEAASEELDAGRSVILDATFVDARWRNAARDLARTCVADLTEIRCVAPLALAQSRVAERASKGAEASDATPAVAELLARIETPWPEAKVLPTVGSPGTTKHALQLLLREPSG